MKTFMIVAGSVLLVTVGLPAAVFARMQYIYHCEVRDATTKAPVQ